MKVVLLQDVPKLGRAGEVKKVANGYGRNYLIPQGLAMLATPEALRMAASIKRKADAERAKLNRELSGLAEQIQGLTLYFAVRASEQGKLYGSVSAQMVAEKINETLALEEGEAISRRQVEIQPIRQLGVYQAPVRLTIDLVPEVRVIVYREGEAPPTDEELAAQAQAEAEAEAAAAAAEAAAEAAAAEAAEAAAEPPASAEEESAAA